MTKKSLIKKKYKYKLLDGGFSNKDISVAKKVLLSRQITMASETRKFEIEFAKKLGVKYALMVNSGSSANLLSMSVLKILYGKGEIITPTLTWFSDIN